MIEELTKKHCAAIEDAEFEEIKHSAIYKLDFDKAATSCTNITLQAIVDVLEGQLKSLRDTLKSVNNYVDKNSRLYFEKFISNEISMKEIEINHYKTLLNQK